MYIYPNKGQSQEQQERDKFECHSWAVKQSGFDPMKQPTASTPPPAREARRGGGRPRSFSRRGDWRCCGRYLEKRECR